MGDALFFAEFFYSKQRFSRNVMSKKDDERAEVVRSGRFELDVEVQTSLNFISDFGSSLRSSKSVKDSIAL